MAYLLSIGENAILSSAIATFESVRIIISMLTTTFYNVSQYI